MNPRLTFQIQSECDCQITSVEPFRVRIFTLNPHSLDPDPVDFEIEGVPEHISKILTVVSKIADGISRGGEEYAA